MDPLTSKVLLKTLQNRLYIMPRISYTRINTDWRITSRQKRIITPLISNTERVMNTESLIKQWFDLWETWDFMDLPISETFRHTSPYGTIEGKAEYLKLVEANRDKFLGHRFEIHDLLFGDNRACVRYTAIQGEFRLEVSEWHYVKNGLIEEIVAYYNIEGEISEERKLKDLPDEKGD